MASPREIKNRITSVKNTQKITRTMELVATAKAKKAVDRVNAAQPFAHKTAELISSLAAGAADVAHPLLRQTNPAGKTVLFIVSANRGLCGSYNAAVIRAGIRRMRELQTAGVPVEVHLIGKKAVNLFRFEKISYASANTELDDKPTFEQGQAIADPVMDRFADGQIDHVEIIYTRYYSAARQSPYLQKILPLTIEAGSEGGATIFEPDAASILTALLPRSVRIAFFQSLLDAAASEQIARRIAMKNATDAASDMIRSMTLAYNRSRQAKITQEIAEIVGGAEAIS